MNSDNMENYRKAGRIAAQTADFARTIIKPGISLLEIAEKIESKIAELGGKPAFPCNLSINEIAAHFTPFPNDETKAHGLLKVDLGVHISGCIADMAFSVDLENKEDNKKLILASEQALNEALKIAREDIEVWKIGQKIQDNITKMNFSPIRNLSGHKLDLWKVHAGLSIPNCNNGNENKIEKGVYAIEPFATSGLGLVYDGKPSGIYKFEERKAVRDLLARKILEFIESEYKTLPFCERWIIKKFGNRAKLSLSFLEQAGCIYQYPQLVEKSHKSVAQSEHTIIIAEKVEVITKL